MVSRENTVIAGCLAFAILLALTLDTYTSLPFSLVMGALLLFGVVVPTATNEYLDRQSTD
ncbi:hypothetical protein ACFO0N_03825 [Halobium salinum]|uniref:Uncharacterized protein n=1 Tax=Halobium salinum TaxID=1364940 RepID=A0ABD5P8I7_9EURY|nr:hypothetical protein [Halobium salinum]